MDWRRADFTIRWFVKIMKRVEKRAKALVRETPSACCFATLVKEERIGEWILFQVKYK